MKKQFIETQKFTQWWIWLVLVVLSAIPLYNFAYVGFSEGLMTSPIFLFVILFCLFKLATKIDEKEIKIVFFPLVWKTMQWADIKTVRLFDYGFVGGWGIRFWTKYGTVYNTSGSKGLLVELQDGKKIVVGTQKEEALKLFLKGIEKIG
jgi:hypothetical protein